ncbi:MAG TPA: efflux transporter outer membrane subunit [Methylibium sp.]|nr:efflux transporter outer membrane subunit [Methylibium sp.]
MSAHRLVPLALAALLAGCASLAPEYERPAAPVAAQFPGAGEADTVPGAPAAAERPWTEFFRDARTRALIELALRNNRDLRVAVLNIEAARAQAQARNADLWPSVNAGITGSRQPSSSGGTNSLYTAGVQLTAYEIDLFGRVRSLNAAAAAQFFASEEARKAAQISLVAAVANAQLALQADEELLRLAGATVASREDSLRLVRLRFEQGASAELELRQAESLLQAARAAQAQLARQRALDENALVLLIGQPLPIELPAAAGTLEALDSLPGLPAGLPSEVLVRRPDVRQAEQQLIAANANIGAARAAFFPKLTLTASAGVASGELADLFKGGHFAWGFAPQLLAPIFDAGRNRANLKAAEVNRDIAIAQYEKAIQSAFREVADALAGRATLLEQLAAQGAQAEAERRRSALAELRWRNGAASHLELFDAQRSLFAAQQAEVQGRVQLAQNGVTLYRVLGGGWSVEPGEGARR